jgi:hypothetical protein
VGQNLEISAINLKQFDLGDLLINIIKGQLPTGIFFNS